MVKFQNKTSHRDCSSADLQRSGVMILNAAFLAWHTSAAVWICSSALATSEAAAPRASSGGTWRRRGWRPALAEPPCPPPHGYPARTASFRPPRSQHLYDRPPMPPLSSSAYRPLWSPDSSADSFPLRRSALHRARLKTSLHNFDSLLPRMLCDADMLRTRGRVLRQPT